MQEKIIQIVDKVISVNKVNAQVICNGKTLHLKKEDGKWLQKITEFKRRKNAEGKMPKVPVFSYVEWKLDNGN